MTLNLNADIDAMMAGDLGVAVTIGAVTSRGILDISNVLEQGQGMEYQRRVTTLLVRTGVFTLTNGVTVTADGVTYRLDESDMEDDGKLMRLILARGS
jgi:hypothetical protein